MAEVLLPATPAAPAAPVLVARGLSRFFGPVKALSRVSFEIPGGVICGLIGPNGAGKTTLLRILAGLDEPDEGERSIDSHDVAIHPAMARARFGYVPDFAALYDGLTVEAVVTFFARAHAVPRPQVPAAVERALRVTGLTPLAQRHAHTLSKGMMQRACVACALVHDPGVLFLDEPASGLDPRARIELKELLKELRTAGKTILISSHILSELGDLVDRVLILERGVVRASGSVEVAWQAAVAQPARVRLEVLKDPQRAMALLSKMVVVETVSQEGLILTVTLQFPTPEMDASLAVASLVTALVGQGVEVCMVVPVKANLESLFMQVTQGELQ